MNHPATPEPGYTARERFLRLLNDPERVTTEQREAVFAEGNFLLLACPGSGKTRTMGLRLAWAMLRPEPRRVSATTYTNVAVGELAAAAGRAGVPVAEPLFVGTLHSFLLRYVVYQFGHLVDDLEGEFELSVRTKAGRQEPGRSDTRASASA